MTEVVIAKNIDITSQDVRYNYTIDLIDINTISFNIMNTDTGVNYKLYIKKDDEWCNGNLYKTQNDFGQLYKMINDCVFNKESIFKYDLIEEKENIKFNMEMKKDSPFFKLDLEFNLKKHISENGLKFVTMNQLESLEYQLNKIRSDNIKAKKILDSLENLVEDINNMNKNFIKNDDKYNILNDCGNLIYEGHIKNNKRDGEGIEYCPTTGQILYKGGFKKGYYHGQGTLYNKSSNQCITINEGQYCKGSFKYGLFDGLIEYYYYNIDKNYKIGHYLARKDNYKNGYVIKYELFNVNDTTSGIEEMKHLTECPHNNLSINDDID
jgi:hypothetical protein